MIIGIPKESYPEERRVALVPVVIPILAKAGIEVIVEADAGISAGYTDTQYVEKGAKIAASRAEVFAAADIIVQVLCYGSNDATGEADLPFFRRGQVLIGFLRPLGVPGVVQKLAATGVTSFAVELMPRTTRAQSMDALSSMAHHLRIQSGAAWRRRAAANVSYAHHRCRNDYARARVCDRRGRGGFAGHCHRAAAGSGGIRVRHAARGEGTGAESGRRFVELPIEARTRRTRAATPPRRTKRFTASNANCWAAWSRKAMW